MNHFKLVPNPDTKDNEWYCDNPTEAQSVTIYKCAFGLIGVYADGSVINREQAGEMAEILKKYSETGELPIH